MPYSFSEWDKPYQAAALEEVAALWNRNCQGRHAFFPWSGALLAHHTTDEAGRMLGRLLIARDENGALAGLVHVNQMLEDGYPWAGVVELILVDKEHRRRGIGGKLLAMGLAAIERFRPRPDFVDALGSWPVGYIYNVLADGSERSGVFAVEPDLYRLFTRAGFVVVRRSVVMRADLTAFAGPVRPLPEWATIHVGKRTARTWLDRVFRDRELWDHELVGKSGEGLLSRAIFGLMQGESRHEGKAIFGVFGVNTPLNFQRRGYAGINFSRMMRYLHDLGGEALELHVYADNAAALALYRSVGFQPLRETFMLHKPLPL